MKTKLELATAEPAQTPLEVEEDEAQATNTSSNTVNNEHRSGHKDMINTKSPHGVINAIEAVAAAASIAIASTVLVVITSLETTMQTQGEAAAAAELSTKATGCKTCSMGRGERSGKMEAATKACMPRE